MKFRNPDPNTPEHLDLNDLTSDAEIHFEFEEDMLASKDTQHFLKCFQPNSALSKSQVHKLFGRVVFSFTALKLNGEIWECPAMRDYISKLSNIYPCWLYYSVPESELLLPILACLCPDLRSVVESKTGLITIELESEQTIPIVLKWMLKALDLAEYSGLPKKQLSTRLHLWLKLLLPPDLAEDYAQKVLRSK